MSFDPNEDLIGMQFTDDHERVLTVTKTASWSPLYVVVQTEDGYTSTRNAALLRKRLL